MNILPRFATRTSEMRRSTIRETLKVIARPGMISFAGGIPASELFPVAEIAAATAAVLKQRGEQALQYGQTEGVPELRDWIAARHSRPQFQVRRENVMIVTGSQQALDLIGRVFLDEDDQVLVENPTYLAALTAWRPLRPKFVPMPSDLDGTCVEEIGPLLKHNPKLLYSIPNFQNPQGTTLSLPRRKRLIQLLHETQTVLIEDNPYGELRYSGEALPHLLELDAHNAVNGELHTRVLYLGTFSKVLAPGFRVGWVIAPTEIIDKLVQAKQATDLHTSTFCQFVILELLEHGVLEQQIPRLCTDYSRRRDAMLAAMAEHFPEDITWTRPDGGMFLFVTLPNYMDAARLLKRAIECNVAFIPGEDFHVDGRGQNTLRLNFSNATPPRIAEGIARLGSLLKEELKNPSAAELMQNQP